MGPYCRFCDQRCFLERRIPGKPGTILLATCERGMERDRKMTGGFDHTNTINPYAAPAAEPAPEVWRTRMDRRVREVRSS